MYTIWYRDTSRGRQYRLQYKWLGIFPRWLRLDAGYIWQEWDLKKAEAVRCGMNERAQYKRSCRWSHWQPMPEED